MFVTTDRFLEGGAWPRSPVPFCTSLPVPAIFSQIRQRGTGHPAAPQPPLVTLRGSIVITKGPVVLPRPEGRGICFSSAREQSAPRVFSGSRSLSHPPGPGLPRIQPVANSLFRAKSASLAFPVTSETFVRPSAPEQKSTPLFSIACALFYKNTGGGVHTSLPNFNSFKMMFLRYPSRQLPWNDILVKTVGGGGATSRPKGESKVACVARRPGSLAAQGAGSAHVLESPSQSHKESA